MSRNPDSRETLLRVAMDLIWESSYGRASVDRICDRANIKKGTFYHHFESKEQLALEALDSQWNSMKHEYDAIFSPLNSPLDRLRQCFRKNLKTQLEMRDKVGFVCGCPLATIGSEISTMEPALRLKVEGLMAQFVTYIESALRDAHRQGLAHVPNPLRTAQIIVDYAEGAQTRARIINDLTPIEQIEAGAMTILGVLEAPTPPAKQSLQPTPTDRSVSMEHSLASAEALV